MTFILTLTTFGASAQNNLHNAKIQGSITIGNQEMTSVLDETTGCVHKSTLHTKNLFVVGESIKLDIKNNNQQSKIIKPNLPENVFVDKCKEQNDPYHEKRMEIIQLPLNEQKVVFSGLNPAFKVGVWKDKWKQVKSLNWTTAQGEWIDDVEKILIQPLFTHNPPHKLWNDFQNNIQPSLESKASTLFDRTTLIKMVSRISDVVPDEPLKRSGECSTKSNYCDDRGACDACHDCGSFWGCGFLWIYSCDGYCR